MEKKNASTFIFSIVAIILGVTLFKQFDFNNLKFEKPDWQSSTSLLLSSRFIFL
jgi:hypothetical protein